MRRPREHKNNADLSGQPSGTAGGISELVTKRIVAKATSVSIRTIEHWVEQRRIPVIRLSPRCVRFDLRRVLGALGRFEVREITIASDRLPKAKSKAQSQEAS
jgi:hypothetical protein